MNKRRLLGIMAQAGVSQRELARRLCKSKNTVNAKINGHTPFNSEEIVQICDILSITSPVELADIFLPQPSQNWDIPGFCVPSVDCNDARPNPAHTVP